MRWIYNVLFPIAFLAFLPGLAWKLLRRPGYKKTFAERFSVFGSEQRKRLEAARGSVWIHAVSVGETMVALSLIKRWRTRVPGQRIVLSTTTTTGQQLARDKAPSDVPVFYCPIDFLPFVRKALRLVCPSSLVILETEIWPNLVAEARHSNVPVYLVNGRMSDKSSRGYARFRRFFAPILENFRILCVQTELDRDRFRRVSNSVRIEVCGNLKFDQALPETFPELSLSDYFGIGDASILLGASTHPGEEVLLARIFRSLRPKFPRLRLVLVPRHVERAAEITNDLRAVGLSFHRKTDSAMPASPVECLLADTTGEMLAFMRSADVVVMGKSFAGHDEGHNLIEPALLGKTIVTGSVLTNFRFVLDVLRAENAVVTVENDDDLEAAVESLLAAPERRVEIGTRARTAIERHAGAADRVLDLIGHRPLT
jgi:3-deoxy-D-manno-octulosonic-acid transferase